MKKANRSHTCRAMEQNLKYVYNTIEYWKIHSLWETRFTKKTRSYVDRYLREVSLEGKGQAENYPKNR